MSNERLPEEPCHYHTSLNKGSRIEKNTHKRCKQGEKGDIYLFWECQEIQLLRNEIRV